MFAFTPARDPDGARRDPDVHVDRVHFNRSIDSSVVCCPLITTYPNCANLPCVPLKYDGLVAHGRSWLMVKGHDDISNLWSMSV